MPSNSITDNELPPSLDAGIAALLEGFFDPAKLQRLQATLRNAHAEGATVADGARVAATTATVGDVDGLREKFERLGQGIGAWLTSLVVENAFGVDVDNAEMGKLGFSAGRHAVAKALTDKMIEGLTGASTSVDPSPQPAANYLSVVLGQVLEAWTVGEVVEIVSAAIPFVDKIEHLADLSDKVVNALGIPDSSSRVLRPYIDNLVVEPLRRHIHKAYRPTLLSDGDIVRAFLRGDYSAEEARDELSIAGYTEKRIDMLIAGQLKWLSLDDALHLSRHGIVDDNFVKAQLRAQGYDEPGAEMAFTAAYSKYIQAIQDDSVAAVKAAYVDRRISDGDFEQYLSAIYPDDATRSAHEVAARTQRDVNTKVLSASQARDCIKAKILPIAAYRDALRREGYDEDAVLNLELLLEFELDAAADVDRLRKQKQDDTAAAQREKDAAAAKKRADAEAQAKLRARGSPAELARAAVRGLVPLDRVKEVLSADLDPDTVQIYLDDIAAQRVTYVQQQQRAVEAEKRNASRGLDVSQLRQAVLDDVLTVAQFADGLQQFKYSAADAAVLVALMRAAKADHDAAVARRAQADTAAKQQGINLGTFEQLVRRGIKSLADYDAQLTALKFGDGARAAMVDLLQQKINEDAAARQLRADTTAGNVERGLSLDQARRAVILNLRTIDDFSAYLLTNKYSVDAQAVLIAELRDDVVQADAARHRRGTADAATEGPLLPLSTVARAARLSVIPASQYEDALRARGYNADDVAVEMDLLVNEIADVQAARAKQAAADAKTTDKGLTLAQLAAAVKAGVAGLPDYQARAVADGLSDDDVATLVRVLSAELANTQAAKARRAELGSSTKPGDVTLAVLEQQVRDGTLSLADYAERLVLAGLDPVDVDLLTALLRDELGG